MILSTVLLLAGLVATAQQRGVISSAPTKIKFVAPKPVLTLTWKEPLEPNKVFYEPRARLVLSLLGGDSATYHTVLVNGRVVGGLQRGFRKGYTIQEYILLEEGNNIVRVQAKRGTDSVMSADRYIVYKKPIVEPQKRVMLIVANQAYPDKPLKNPVSDGLAVKEKFEQLGYEVLFHTDQSKSSLLATLNVFKEKLKKTNVGMFYYAGHGLMSNGLNYVEPIGADVSSKARISEFCVSLDMIQAEMQEANPHGTNLVFWDACRNNPSLAMRGATTMRPPANPPMGSLVIFATSAGDTTPDDSPFAEELVKQLDVPDLEIADLIRAIYRALGTKGLKPHSEGFLPEKFYITNN